REGPAALAGRLDDLVTVVQAGSADDPERLGDRRADAMWWAAHLLGEVLLRVADAAPYRRVLRRLASRVTDRAQRTGGFTPGAGLDTFGPWFWQRLPLATAGRLDLMRLLLPADGPPPAGEPGGAGPFLTAAAALLCADTEAGLPAVCRWFTDDRPLQSAPDQD